MTSVVKKRLEMPYFVYCKTLGRKTHFCNFMNLRVVIKPVFHDKYILANFFGFPEILVLKGLNYVEYVVCWKRNEKDKKKKKKRLCVTLGNWGITAWYQSLGIRIPRELGCGYPYTWS